MAEQPEITIEIGLSASWNHDPAIPYAKRGSTAYGREPDLTREQLEAGLVWWPCSFCGGFVLVGTAKAYREKCACGARRCYSKNAEGWRRDGETWWFC